MRRSSLPTWCMVWWFDGAALLLFVSFRFCCLCSFCSLSISFFNSSWRAAIFPFTNIHEPQVMNILFYLFNYLWIMNTWSYHLWKCCLEPKQQSFALEHCYQHSKPTFDGPETLLLVTMLILPSSIFTSNIFLLIINYFTSIDLQKL